MCVQDVDIQILGSRNLCQKSTFLQNITWCVYVWLRPILVIVAKLLSNFKYGNLFEEMANASQNDNITIVFKISLG